MKIDDKDNAQANDSAPPATTSHQSLLRDIARRLAKLVVRQHRLDQRARKIHDPKHG